MTGRAERSGSELALMARLTTPLWLITPGGRTVWLNASARSMVGLAPEQAPDRLAAHMAGTTLPRAEPILFRLGNRETVVPCRLYQTDNHLLAEADPVSGRDQPDLIHHLSHELRTPLNAIIGFADIMAEQILGPVGNERYRGYAADIRGAGRYMLTLVNNLLDLAKIEAGRLELDEEPCDLDVLIGTTVSMIRQRAGQAGVILEIVPTDDVPRIRGDAILVRQMLTNLLTNAVKFCKPAGGRVSVGASLDLDGGVTLTVMDNGVGMAPDQIPQALSPFGQVRNRPAHAERGTGLGLSLTKALIELHGGSISLDSRPDHGTTIRLRFPPDRVI